MTLPLRVVVVANDNGGAGKSTVALNLIGWAIYSRAVPTALIDCDRIKPDTYRRLSESIDESRRFVLDVRQEGGWSELVSRIEAIGSGLVVVNLPCQVSTTGPEERIARLGALRQFLAGSVATLWVMDASEDSVRFLKDEMELCRREKQRTNRPPIQHWLVLRNLHHGPPESFFWTDCKTREWYIGEGRPEADFPRLWTKIAGLFRRHSYDVLRTAKVDLHLGDRLTLLDWFDRTDEFWNAHAALLGLGDLLEVAGVA